MRSVTARLRRTTAKSLASWPRAPASDLPFRADVGDRNALTDLAERIDAVVVAVGRHGLLVAGDERVRHRDREVERADQERGRRAALAVDGADDEADAAERGVVLVRELEAAQGAFALGSWPSALEKRK